MKLFKLIISFALLGLILIPLTAINSFSQEIQKQSFKPQEGYVPNAETAIRIAVAVWVPIYGKEQIEKQKPYQATLKDGIWFVCGSLPKGWKGGVAEAEISKDDGRILRVIHSK